MRLVCIFLSAAFLFGAVAPHWHAVQHHKTATACCQHAGEHERESCLHTQVEDLQHSCPASIKALARYEANRVAYGGRLISSESIIPDTSHIVTLHFLTQSPSRAPPSRV